MMPSFELKFSRCFIMYYFDFKTSKGLSVVCFVFELGDAGGELRDTHLQKVVAVFGSHKPLPLATNESSSSWSTARS